MQPQPTLTTLATTDQASFWAFGLGASRPCPFDCVHHAFESHARVHPHAVAIEDFEQRITYSDLDHQANCLAVRLRALGVVPGSRVCLLVERSILMVVGILAVLKAGGAYVPMDGNIVSSSALEYALKDSGTSIVLVLRKFIGRVSKMPVICLEDMICEHPETTHCPKPEDLSGPGDSVYIIYTSGK